MEDYLTDIRRIADRVKGNGACLALNCGTLVAIHKNKGVADSFKSLLRRRISFLFVYDISPGISESEALNYLTDGTIRAVSFFPSNDYKYKVSEDFREICRQFSGLSFGPINNRIDSGFHISEHTSNVDSLVSINKQPLFLRTINGTDSVRPYDTTSG